MKAMVRSLYLQPGPCTNIVRAIRKDKEFPKKFKKLIVMGGAKYTGNMSPVAEYNFWADPLAAKEVMNAGFHEIVMIGLDVTNKIALGRISGKYCGCLIRICQDLSTI